MARRLLLRGAMLVTMDEHLGDLAAELLVDDDRIAAIGPDLDADGGAAAFLRNPAPPP